MLTPGERNRLIDRVDRVNSATHAVNSALNRHGEPTGPQLRALIVAAEDLAKETEQALFSLDRRR